MEEEHFSSVGPNQDPGYLASIKITQCPVQVSWCWGLLWHKQRMCLLSTNLGWSRIRVSWNSLFPQHFHMLKPGLGSPFSSFSPLAVKSSLDCPLTTSTTAAHYIQSPLKSHPNPLRVLFLSWVAWNGSLVLLRWEEFLPSQSLMPGQQERGKQNPSGTETVSSSPLSTHFLSLTGSCFKDSPRPEESTG